MTFEAEGEINCVSMFPDGNAVVAGCETCNRSAVEGTAKEEWEDTTGAATFFDIRSGAIISKFTRRKQKCTNVQWSRSGRILFISYEEGNVGMWDPWTQGGIKHKIPAHLNPNPKESVVSAMVMSPDGAVLALPASHRPAPQVRLRTPPPTRPWRTSSRSGQGPSSPSAHSCVGAQYRPA